MENKLVEEKREFKEYLCLPVLENPKYGFRFLYYNISENVITTDEAHTHNNKSLWIPVYLASDIFTINSFPKCNKCRIHAAFRKQGLAAKLTFPRGMRLSGVPAGDTGVWFYSVYGVIQAVMQYAKCQSEQVAVLEAFMDTWKLRVEDAKLPDSSSNPTVIHCDTTVVPFPEDLKPRSSHLVNSKSTSASKPSQSKSGQSYSLPSGCMIARHGSDFVQFSKSPSKIPVNPNISTVRNSNLKESLCFESNCQKHDKTTVLKFTQQSPSSSANTINKNIITCSSESVQIQGCDSNKETEQDGESSRTADEDTCRLVKRRVCGHLKITTSGQCLNCSGEGDLHAKLIRFVDNLKLAISEHSGCSLKECLSFLLDEFLKLGEDEDYQSKKIAANHLWNNQSLICLSRWMGAKFRLMVPEVIKKVDNFKKANFDVIAELPSERQLISELFPPPMWELLIVWMGMTTSLNRKCGESSLVYDSCDENIQKKYSLLLLLLEFANQALVSGVAHVLYPRFVSS